MALFRLLVIVAIIISIAGAGLYFAPDNIKEKVLSYVNDSPYVPSEIKKEVEKLYATPAMKREKLITELTDNLLKIEAYITKNTPSPESPEAKLLERSQQIIAEVLEQNAEPGVVKQITDAVTAKLLSSGNACVPK